MISRQERDAMRSLGREAAKSIYGLSSQEQVFSRDFAKVTKVSSGRLDLDLGNASYPMPMVSVPTTTACSGVKVGDTVVVDTYCHVPLVIGVLS